jgi:ribosome-associated translation inhibitor RaiA
VKLQLHAKGVRLTDELRRHVERRARFALRRFGERVRHITVRLTDVNGPKGGTDIQCCVLAALSPSGEIVIREMHSDPFSAVSRACERARHGLARRLERLRTRRRRS